MKKIKDSKQLVFNFMKGDDIELISKNCEFLDYSTNNSWSSSWAIPYTYVFDSDTPYYRIEYASSTDNNSYDHFSPYISYDISSSSSITIRNI